MQDAQGGEQDAPDEGVNGNEVRVAPSVVVELFVFVLVVGHDDDFLSLDYMNQHTRKPTAPVVRNVMTSG